MDHRRLRYFVTIAEQGGIGRAAEVLHVAQPALSRQLRLLESELGTALLTRHPDGVRMTAAGQTLLKGARQILDDTARLAALARAIGQGYSGELSIGVSDIYCWHPVVISMVDAFRQEYPGIALQLQPLLSGQIQERVLSGRLDGGMVFAPQAEPDSAPLQRLPVLRDQLALAVHRDHPLTARPALRQFTQVDFIVPASDLSPRLHSLVIRQLTLAGLSPSTLHHASSHTAALGLVAAGMGCAVVPACAHLRVPDNVTVRRVSGLSLPIPIELIWRRDNPSPSLARFITIARRIQTRARQPA